MGGSVQRFASKVVPLHAVPLKEIPPLVPKINMESKVPKNYQSVMQALGEADNLKVPTVGIRKELKAILDSFNEQANRIAQTAEQQEQVLINNEKQQLEQIIKQTPQADRYFTCSGPRAHRHWFDIREVVTDPYNGNVVGESGYWCVEDLPDMESKEYYAHHVYRLQRNNLAIQTRQNTQNAYDTLLRGMQQQLDDNTARTEVEIDKLMNSSGFNIMTAWKNVGKVAEPQQVISQTNQLNQAYYPQKSSAPIGRRKPAFTTGIFKEKERE